jgi:two-component system, response regulator YesN
MYEILVAEDEALERDAVCSVIAGAYPAGISLHRAENGLEALRIARERELDAAFLDIRMPGLDGLEAAREIRAVRPGLPMVFLTACERFDYARRAVSLGIDEYLLKPAENDEILAALERMLEARRSESRRKEGEREREEIIASTASYLRGEIERGLSEGRLDASCLAEYVKASGAGLRTLFLAAFRLPEEKRAAMSPGLLRALLSRIVKRVQDSCASRGFFPLGAPSPTHAFVLCMGTGDAAGASARGSARAMVEEALRRATGDLGMPVRAGIAFGPAEGLLEAARSASGLAKDARPVVTVSDGARDAATADAKGGGASRRLAETAMALMAEELGRDISLGGIAARMRVSPSHLSRIFSGSGFPGFSATLARLRVEKAKELLRGGSSVKEAAALTGFKDPAYFSRVFRRLSGMSPTEFLGGNAEADA